MPSQSVDRWFLIILVCGILLRLFVDTSYFFWDETNYIMNAQFYVEGDAPYVQLYERPPLLSLLLTPIYHTPWLMVLMMILINSLSLVAIYQLGLGYGKQIARIAMMLLALFPFHILSSKWIMTDALSLLLLLYTVILFKGAMKDQSKKKYVGAGALLALSVLLKFTNALFFIFIALLFIFQRPKIKPMLYAAVSFVVFFIPYLIHNVIVFKDAFYPIVRATHVIATPQEVSWLFIFSQIVLFLGIICIPLLFSFFSKKKDMFLISWFVIAIIYFIALVQKGVAIPPTIEWEVQRFLFPALAPALLLAAIYLSKVKIHWQAAMITAMIIFFLPSYALAYTPKIEFQEGLREVSFNIASYAKDYTKESDCLYTKHNWPVIGYYAERKVFHGQIPDDCENTYEILVSTDKILPGAIHTASKEKYTASIARK